MAEGCQGWWWIFVSKLGNVNLTISNWLVANDIPPILDVSFCVENLFHVCFFLHFFALPQKNHGNESNGKGIQRKTTDFLQKQFDRCLFEP